MLNNKWNCVIITCPTVGACDEIDKEICILKKKRKISEDLLVITVEDPVENIGSGAATLNALLKAAEHLSAKQNYMVVSSDVLNEARILILHNGRKSVFTFTEKAFITLPMNPATYHGFVKHHHQVLSNLEMTLRLVDQMSNNSPYGVWVCSTDMMILQGKDAIVVDWQNIADVAMFCIPAARKYANDHGVVAIGEQGLISNIYYRGTEDQLKALAQSDGKVPLVSGIVYMSVKVAESLLSLHAQTPLDSCTYLGIDSGAEAIQVSLFFDLLVVMSSEIDQESFINGKCGKTYNLKAGLTFGSTSESRLARKIVWNTLSKYRMSLKILPGCQHLYWSNDCARQHMDNLFLVKQQSAEQMESVCCYYELVDTCKVSVSHDSLFVNIIGCAMDTYEISSGCIVYDSKFFTKSLYIGSNSYVSGVEFFDLSCDLRIPPDLVVINTWTLENPANNFFIMFGVNENLMVPVDFMTGSFCNKTWKEQLNFLKLTEKDLWPADLDSNERTLMNAKLFIPNKPLPYYLDLFHNSSETDPVVVDEYQKIPSRERYSISDVLDLVDLERAHAYRRSLYSKIGQNMIREILQQGTDLPLTAIFIAACAESWHLEAMAAIDKVLFSEGNYVIKSRAASNMADLLAELAGSKGGLRSGPGSNRLWSSAFTLIGNEKIKEGFEALQTLRNKWVCRPDHLIRAARHYERAVQIFIHFALLSPFESINTHETSSACKEIGSYVTVTCPARIDIQGGWSDTPPICYELGGSVINMALLVDGKKPIGTKVCRTNEPTIVIKQRSGDNCVEIVIKHMDDLNNLNQPHVTGALVKAAVVVSRIILLESSVPLSEQLHSRGGGFYIETWSLLPQGCGMGTSSILAAAVLAALWNIAGYTFDSKSLIHAVLLLEQFMTTGGGWQDQVAGVIGGINRGYSEATIPLVVKVDKISPSPEFIKELNARLLLIYTGKVRLAKNLLQHVIRNWYSKELLVTSCFEDLISHSLEMKKALENEDLSKIGELMNKYWEQKKLLAPGCEPLTVKTIMEKLKPICYGQLLAGAGGGGFMCILTKEPDAKETVKDVLSTIEGNESMSLHSATIDFSGLEIEHDGYILCFDNGSLFPHEATEDSPSLENELDS